MRLFFISVTLLTTPVRLVKSLDELDCKPRPGCHIAKCDPVRLPFPQLLHRNEYPIVCVKTATREDTITREDYQVLMNLFRNSLKNLITVKEDLSALNERVAKTTDSIQALQAIEEKRNKKIASFEETIGSSQDEVKSLQYRHRKQARKLNDLDNKCKVDSTQTRALVKNLREDMESLTKVQGTDSRRLNKIYEKYTKLLKEMQRFNLDRSIDLLKLLQLEKAIERLQPESVENPLLGRSGQLPSAVTPPETTASVETRTVEPEYLKVLKCDFDTRGEMCSLKNSVDDDFDWTQHSGKTQNPSTGPKKDRTKRKKDGGYIYIDGSAPRKPNDLAILETPKFIAGNYCVRFSIHMFGSDMGDIQIRLIEFFHGRNRSKPLWYRYGDHGRSWEDNHVYFETSPETVYMKLEFRGWRGQGPASDAAIDDINIKQEKCKKN